LKHHEIAALLTKGVNVIQLTHYSAENYGFNKIYLKIREELKVPSAYFCDGNLI
ncbi:MAG: Nif3-like dinuclear metal center hexameric protein, partial [Clostridia bacterium]|nr:Nif3-like dinuclear metal center hexameric protein [Clostridia bacterium]